MEEKHYASYAEIDRNLEILKLEREIHIEKIKFHYENIKDNLKLGNLVEGYLCFSKESKSSWVSQIVDLMIPFIIKFVKKKTEK